MFNGRFRRLLPAIAGLMVLAIGTASIPAISHADGGGEGRDSHDKSKDKDPPKKNPKPPASLFDEKRF
ncbi:MAG TPA: hypothetical protein VKB42_21005 [Dongiaceae bacterium]|nr:hypothetical protein [Dongiaceae bacterium]